MIFIWGKKYVYRQLGYVADLCQLCRTSTVWRVRRVGLARHVYYLPFGQGEFVENDRVCEKCNSEVVTELTKYAAIAPRRASVSELQRQTYPDLAQIAAQYRAVQETARDAPAKLSQEQRQDLLYAPFVMLSPKVEQHFSGLKLDATVVISLAAVIGLGALVIPRFTALGAAQSQRALLMYLGAATLFMFWQLMTVGKRYIRNQIVPQLVQALAPLRPSVGEVRVILSTLRKRNLKLGEKLKPETLLAALKSPKKKSP
jgi:hypothetical protein